MGKVFEDYFSELQVDMVAIALEYASNEVDSIYVYAACENTITSFNVFYRKFNNIFHKHQLNNFLTNKYDISSDRQNAFLKIGLNDLDKMKEVCEKFDREMPTEIKLTYDVKQDSLDAKYNYDLKFSNSETLTARDIFLEWFEEVKKENGHDLG